MKKPKAMIENFLIRIEKDAVKQASNGEELGTRFVYQNRSVPSTLVHSY